MLNVLSTKFLVGALSLAIVAPTAYAATQDDSASTKTETTVQEKAPWTQNLDDETKAKVEEIQKQVDAGTLTKEEAHQQLEALGVHPHFGGKGEDLVSKHWMMKRSKPLKTFVPK